MGVWLLLTGCVVDVWGLFPSNLVVVRWILGGCLVVVWGCLLMVWQLCSSCLVDPVGC